VWVWDGTRWLLWDNQIAQWVWSPVTDTWSGLKDDWNWARDKFTEWRRDPRGWGQYLWDGTKWVLVGVWDTTKDLIVNNPVTDAASGTWQFVKGAWVWVTGGSGGGAQGSGLPAGGRI
jgi:hypothetical protein